MEIKNTNKTLNKRIRRIYSNIKTRCYNPLSNRYYIYGAKGIKMCEEWKNNYGSFQKWAFENGYADNLTIDRIDNNGNYEPKNCRWVTYREQNRNTSRNRIITLNNETKPITDWCETYKIPYYIVNNRLNKYGWDIKKSLETPIRKASTYKYNGEILTIAQISEKYNIPKYKLFRLAKKNKLN